MKSVAKAEAWMRDLKEKLEFRIAGSSSIDTIAESKDANGWPMLKLSDGGVVTAGSPVVLLRIKSIDAVSKDVFGNSLVAFAPHELEVAYELDSTEAEPSRIDLAIIFAEVFQMGIKVLIKEVADATAVDETSLNATAVAKAIEPVITWPKKGM